MQLWEILTLERDEYEDADDTWTEVVGQVPRGSGEPENGGRHPTDILQVLALAHSLVYEVEHEGGGDETHGEDHTDPDHQVPPTPD